MSTEPKGGGAPASTSGTQASPQEIQNLNAPAAPAAGDPNANPKLIKPEDHERALNDLHRFKTKAQDAEARVAAAEAREREANEKLLKGQNDYKTLWEKEKVRADSAEKEKTNLYSDYFNQKKRDAIREAAIRANLRKEAESDLDLIDLKDIVIEKTDQGRVIVHGAEGFVNDLKKNRPHWFKSGDVARINSGGTGSQPADSGEVTPATLYALEKKDPKAYKAALEKYLAKRKA